MTADLPDFSLDPRLDADTYPIGDFALSTVRLMNDARFPWLILVPRRDGLAELIDLTEGERAALTGEIDHASRVLKDLTACEKLNVAALGNIVRQLHIHVVARSAGDAAWPAPVWGQGTRTPYQPAEAEHLLARLRTAFGFI